MDGLLARLRALDVVDDPAAVLAERGLSPDGTISAGGVTRLMPTADGWLAVCLARPDDLDLVPAWLGVEPTWEAIGAAVRSQPADDVCQRGALLGLAVAVLGETTDAEPCRATRLGDAPPIDVSDVTVVDLSSLWAGPLCGALLADRGARVIKVESVERPDGARRGNPAFFDRMNRHKEQRSVPLASFAEVIADADVVIEASRPRALRHLGIDAEALVRDGRPRVWLSITGHGRDVDRVGFGDDAAVAGGLVVWEHGQPGFLGDAVADPCTGLAATRAVLDALAGGGRWLLDVALARVARALS